MPYRSDFYCAENLVGYTGKLDDFPTVYFHKPSTGEFGHITQSHGLARNVGREAVRIADGGYRMANEQVRDQTGQTRLQLVEYSGTRRLHTSRNTFMPKDSSNEGTLLQALQLTEEKPMSIWYDLEDGTGGQPGIELMWCGAPRDSLGRRGAISAGSSIRIA